MAENNDVIQRAIDHVLADDMASAGILIEAQPDAISAAEVYSKVGRQLARRDIGKAVALLRMGVGYALRQSDHLKPDQPALALRLRELAKIMTYNLGADTWPGWSVDSVIADADRRAGHEAALLSLALVECLNLDAKQQGTAHWLVGAHELAAGNTASASASFQEAARYFASGNHGDLVLLAQGYDSIARRTDLNSILAALATSASSDAAGFRVQLITAQKVFP